MVIYLNEHFQKRQSLLSIILLNSQPLVPEGQGGWHRYQKTSEQRVHINHYVDYVGTVVSTIYFAIAADGTDIEPENGLVGDYTLILGKPIFRFHVSPGGCSSF